MKVNQSADILSKLLSISLGHESDFQLLPDIDWTDVVNLSYTQGVSALAFDGLQKIYSHDDNVALGIDAPELEKLKYEWLGHTISVEIDYKNHVNVLCELLHFYNNQCIPSLVFKGYALSLLYPEPSHRQFSDIDIYHFHLGEFSDIISTSFLGVKIDQNGDKHSTFIYKGILVENHKSFIEDSVFRSLEAIEAILEEETKNCTLIEINSHKITVQIPSDFMNAIYLPIHSASHFFRGEMTIRHVVDWACFINQRGTNVDWTCVDMIIRKNGFYKFYSTINSIIKDKLGVELPFNMTCCKDELLVSKVYDDLFLQPTPTVTLAEKVKRYLANRWKFKLIYDSNFFVTFFRLSIFYVKQNVFKIARVWNK